MLAKTLNDIELISKTVQKLPYSERRDTILLMLAVLTNTVTENYGHAKDPVE
ncbi:MAG: hypothetical protein WBG90_08815 [Saonia sp.]